MKYLINFSLAISCCFQFSYSQNVGIGTQNPNASSLLDLTSTSRGFLPPRMTTTSRRAIVNPAAGLMVYDTSTDSFWYFDNGKWNELTTANKLVYQIPSDRINPNGDAGDNFGFSVCLGSTGTQGYVGSPMLGNGGNGTCHRVSFADNNLWTISTMVPGGLLPGDAYGYSVAMDRVNNSNIGIISAPFDDSSTVTDMGCAYFFEGSTLIHKVYAPLGGRISNAKFGRSLDISGNSTSAYAIVGAPGANAGKGIAYLYQYNPNTSGWDFEASLTDNLGAAADSFGLAVSLYYNVAGDTAWAFVGAPYDDENAVPDLGSVTVFRKAQASAIWTRVAKIIPIDTDEIGFGYAIDNVMRCGHVLIGAPMRSSGIGRMFDAVLLAYTAPTATFDLNVMPAPGGSAGVGTPGLGFKVSAMAIPGNSCEIYVLAGSFSGIITSNTAASFGIAYQYRYSNGNWILQEKITDPAVETTGYGFGRAVSIHTSSKTILIGAPNQKVEAMSGRGKVQFRQLAF